MKIKAETTVHLNGGMSGGYGARGTMVLDTEVEFQYQFCTLHQETAPYEGNCAQCDQHTRALAEEVIERSVIDCVTNLRHNHECRCWIGHDCDRDLCTVQAQLRAKTHKADGTPRLDEDGNPIEPNAMEVLGAEAPNAATLGIVRRIAQLEKENEALKVVVLKLVGLLPEDTREALGCTEVLLGSSGRTSV